MVFLYSSISVLPCILFFSLYSKILTSLSKNLSKGLDAKKFLLFFHIFIKKKYIDQLWVNTYV